MISVGLNGFGRIGKCIFLQLIESTTVNISVINAPSFDIQYIYSYLKYDSTHKYTFTHNIRILDANRFEINGRIVEIVRTREAKNINWISHGIQYVIDATGSYLTTDLCKEHNVPYVIMTAPPKDNTPIYIYGVNHEAYCGESIVSNASCTTNCIAPVLRLLHDTYGIHSANFTTIHATTASQTIIDTSRSNARIHRSVLNNIIPYTTGASKSIIQLIPSLQNKIYGTSIRVPVNNVSIVDLNIVLEVDISYKELFLEIEKDPYLQINSEQLVSCDFMTTTCPSIIDKKASMSMGKQSFKLMIWYDNEWSYSAQVIQLLTRMIHYNESH